MLSSKLFLWAVSWIPSAVSMPAGGKLEPRTKDDPSKPWRFDVTPAIRAQFDFKPYVLRDACLDCTRANTTALFECDVKCRPPARRTAVSFLLTAPLVEWFDPNSVKENNVTSCSCSYSWKWDGVTTEPGVNNTFDPQVLFPCFHDDEHAPFEMRVNRFHSPNNLTLWISHLYKDSSFVSPGTGHGDMVTDCSHV